MLRRIRITAQLAALALFLYLLVRTVGIGEDRLGPPVRIFLEIDPLVGLTTWLRTGALHGLLGLSLVTLGLSFLLGRSFCGWICPLGTLSQISGRLARPRVRERRHDRSRHAQLWKYAILLLVLGGAVSGALWTGLLDPICLLIRGLAVGTAPLAEVIIRGTGAALASTPVSGASEPLYRWVRDHLLAYQPPVYEQGMLLGTLLLLLLLASWWMRRFWCRILCPLGALLGATALSGTLRLHQDGDRCTGCTVCTYHCQGAADPDLIGSWKASECFVCGNCTSACARNGLRFGFEAPRIWSAGRAAFARWVQSHRSGHRRATPTGERSAGLATTDLTRRGLLAAAIVGLASGPAAMVTPARTHPPGRVIRPPGAGPEDEFLDRCIRCGECMKVCPQGGLHPAAFESGLAGLWTPVLRPRLGYCEYHCTLCGQVCPTRAIPHLSPADKVKSVLGLAWVDPGRCLPLAFALPCIVCEEHCPTSPKAIQLTPATVRTIAGEERQVRQPRIDAAMCTGCGICEYVCPLEGSAAIQVEGTGRTTRAGAFEQGIGLEQNLGL